MEKVLNSPLQYPGGKRWLFKRLTDFIPANTQAMVSPFLGGGAVELNLALRGIRVHGYDACPHLVNFWQHWLANPSAIINDAPKILRGYDKEGFAALKANYENIAGAEHRALLYYVFNRIAFGGKTLHDKTYFKRYKEKDGVLYRTDGTRLFPNTDFWRTPPDIPIQIGVADFSESLSRHPHLFAYCDPPYVKVGKDFYLACAGEFDHERLATILKSRENWILSYNDSIVVRTLYAEYLKIAMGGRNFSTNRKTSTELLIFSHDIGEQLKYQQQNLF